MRRQIWIPNWLYLLLPWAALVVGGAGVLASKFNFVLLIASMLLMGYGYCVMVIRVYARWQLV